MIEITHRPTVECFFNQEDVSGFWLELGVKTQIPESFRFLYQSGCMMVIEPANYIAGIHIGCLKGSRGKASIKFAKDCFKRIFDMGYQVICARIQRERRDVAAFAYQCGMRRYMKNNTHIYMRVLPCH